MAVVARAKGEKRDGQGEKREALVEGLEMPLSASVSSRGLLLCLYGRALFNGRFSRVCESPCKNTFWTATASVTRDTFDAFLSYRAGIYPDLETESRCFRYLFYIECGIDTPREKLAFWQNFANLSSICSFFFFFFKRLSLLLENPSSPEISSFPSYIFPIYIYLVFHDERISNCQSNMSITITPPPRSFSPSAFYLA